MTYTYYQTMILIPPDSPILFAKVAEQLQKHFTQRNPAAQCSIEHERVTLTIDDEYRLRIHWEAEPHILIESQEIAAAFDHPQKAIIATCDRRIITSGDADPSMNFFNDYVYVLEVLEDLPNVFVFDPLSGKFR